MARRHSLDLVGNHRSLGRLVLLLRNMVAMLVDPALGVDWDLEVHLGKDHRCSFLFQSARLYLL